MHPSISGLSRDQTTRSEGLRLIYSKQATESMARESAWGQAKILGFHDIMKCRIADAAVFLIHAHATRV